jgi:alanyl-tRNA synthetase
VGRTGEIGSLLIVHEEAVSAGVRRVEALVGTAAIDYVQKLRGSTSALAHQLGVKPDELSERIGKLQTDLKSAQRDISTLRDKLAAAQTTGATPSELREAGGFSFTIALLDGIDAGALRKAADNLLQKSQADLVVLGSGKLLVAKVGPSGQARGAHAGNIVRELAKRAGGGGGGRPDMAQAGVKDPSKLGEAFNALPEILTEVSTS